MDQPHQWLSRGTRRDQIQKLFCGAHVAPAHTVLSVIHHPQQAQASAVKLQPCLEYQAAKTHGKTSSFIKKVKKFCQGKCSQGLAVAVAASGLTTADIISCARPLQTSHKGMLHPRNQPYLVNSHVLHGSEVRMASAKAAELSARRPLLPTRPQWLLWLLCPSHAATSMPSEPSPPGISHDPPPISDTWTGIRLHCLTNLKLWHDFSACFASAFLVFQPAGCVVLDATSGHTCSGVSKVTTSTDTFMRSSLIQGTCLASLVAMRLVGMHQCTHPDVGGRLPEQAHTQCHNLCNVKQWDHADMVCSVVEGEAGMEGLCKGLIRQKGMHFMFLRHGWRVIFRLICPQQGACQCPRAGKQMNLNVRMRT